MSIFITVCLLLFVTGYITVSIYETNVLTTSPSRKPGPYNPKDYGLAFEEVQFQSAATDHLNLKGWWIPHPESSRVLILVHVKNGDRSFPLPMSKPLWEKGFNLLLFDLRGHGQSEGDHYTYGQFEQYDIAGAVNFLKAKGYRPGGIGIIGWSMGAASSLMAMGLTQDIKAGVSESSYGDLGRVARKRLGIFVFFYPGITTFGRLLLQADIDQVRPEEAVRKLGTRHLMLIQGDQDSQVPLEEVYHLRDAAGPSVSDTWVIPGAGHAEAFSKEPAEYLRRVVSFFNRELD